MRKLRTGIVLAILALSITAVVGWSPSVGLRKPCSGLAGSGITTCGSQVRLGFRAASAATLIRVGTRARGHSLKMSSDQEDADESKDMIGFWQLMDDGDRSFTAADNICLRANGQVSGGPPVKGFENVSWAGEQRPAGGHWRYEKDEEGKRVLRVILLLPPRSAAERTSGVRFGTELSGRVIELSVQDPNSGEQVVTTRVLGKITSGMVSGEGRQVEISDGVPSGTFSMVKLDTQNKKLVMMVKPFSMPFGTDVESIEKEMEEDHDPAGMHNKLRESLEEIGPAEGENQQPPLVGIPSFADNIPAVGSGRTDDGVSTGKEGEVEDRSGEELAMEMAREIKLQKLVEDEKKRILGILEDGEESQGDGEEEGEGGAGKK